MPLKGRREKRMWCLAHTASSRTGERETRLCWSRIWFSPSIKAGFNKDFGERLANNEDEMAKIDERNERARKIMKELKSTRHHTCFLRWSWDGFLRRWIYLTFCVFGCYLSFFMWEVIVVDALFIIPRLQPCCDDAGQRRGDYMHVTRVLNAANEDQLGR